MKQKIYISKIIIALGIIISNSIFYTKAQTWELKWSDEFDYTGLPDNTKWGYDVGGSGWGNNELEYYTQSRTENARVENGTLIIEARKEAYGGKNYTSARLVTKNKGDWKYGKIEIRAKIPGGRGSWPAIWMLPTDWVYGGWPSSGELDIMEYVGYDPSIIHGTVHTDSYNGAIGTQKGDTAIFSDAETAFHVYRIEWTESKVMFFVDNWKYFTFSNLGTWQKWPFDQRFHLLMNIAIGGNWGGIQGVDDNIFPIRMVVDYVRVYQDITLSIKKNENETPLSISPNPAQEHINIGSTKTFNQIEIYSLSGQKVYDLNVENSKSSTLDIHTLKTGTYILEIKNNKGKVQGKQQFIKKE